MKRVVLVLVGMLLAVGCDMPSQFEGAVQVKHLGVLQAEGQYDNGARSGTWTYYDGTGAVSGQGTYANGKMVNGLEVVYFDNGNKMSEGNWENGQRDGHWIFYFRSGQKQTEGLFLHGKKTGLWKEYDASGYYALQKIYEEDHVVGWGDYKMGRLGHPLTP